MPWTTLLLSDQVDTEQEANTWASLCQEGCGYAAHCDPFGSARLPLIRPNGIRRAASSFSPSTGVGADNVSPRAFSRLSDSLLIALWKLFMAFELFGDWPSLVNLALIVLLP